MNPTTTRAWPAALGRVLYAGLLALSLTGAPARASAADLWGGAGMTALCAESPVVGRDTLEAALAGYVEVVEAREGIDPARIRQVDPARLVPVLERAATAGMGPLEVFTDPQFAAGGPCVLFLDHAALAALDRRFDLHGLWMVRAPVAGEADVQLAMRYMLLGDGRLLVGYPRKGTVQVADYAIFTGHYDYQPYMALDIVSTPQRRALVGLRTLGAPSEAAGPFVGPLGAAIRELELAGREVVVRYRVWGDMAREMRVAHPPVTRR